MKKGFKIGIASIMAVIGLLFVFGITPSPSMERSEGVTVIPEYRVTLYRPNEGIVYEAEVGNLITDSGLNLVRQKLAGTSAESPENVTYMGLSNDTADPVITDTNLSMLSDDIAVNSSGAYTTCGLEMAVGTVSFGDNGGTADAGNWSVSYKWTSTCDNIQVWKFGVFNGSTIWDASEQDTMFSAGNFTANVSLQSNDELTVNVTYIVS